jgi:hypothetical protein
MRHAGQVARIGEVRNAYKIVVRKYEWKRPFERPRHKWNYDNEVNVKETGYEVVDRIHLAQDRVSDELL